MDPLGHGHWPPSRGQDASAKIAALFFMPRSSRGPLQRVLAGAYGVSRYSLMTCLLANPSFKFTGEQSYTSSDSSFVWESDQNLNLLRSNSRTQIRHHPPQIPRTPSDSPDSSSDSSDDEGDDVDDVR